MITFDTPAARTKTETMRPSQNLKCLNPAHRDRQVYARGLCQKCYISARNLISANKTSWKKLEKAGKAAKSHYGSELSESASWLLGGKNESKTKRK